MQLSVYLSHRWIYLCVKIFIGYQLICVSLLEGNLSKGVSFLFSMLSHIKPSAIQKNREEGDNFRDFFPSVFGRKKNRELLQNRLAYSADLG